MNQLNKDKILSICGCDKNNPLYNELSGKFDGLLKEFFSMAQSGLWIKQIEENIDKMEFVSYGTKVVFFCALTVGNGVNEGIKKKFESGEYMEGIILDAICSAYLFELSNEIKKEVKSEISKLNLQLWDIYSPGDNLDIKFQKIIAEALTDEITVNEMGIISPSKSMTFIVSAGEGETEKCTTHNCINCNKNADCVYAEKCCITILNDVSEIECFKGENLHDVLLKNGYDIPVPCGKKGVCGRCRVLFSGKYINSCTFTVNEDISIRVPDEESGFKILQGEGNQIVSVSGDIFISADIGTTTCVLEFRDSEGKVAASASFLNPQRKFGLDVIARIKSASEGHLEVMSSELKEEIIKNIIQFLYCYPPNSIRLKHMVLSMNTVMAYLFLGESPEKLGVYPFETDLGLDREFSFSKLFHTDVDMPVTVIPYISAFVGGDILSGIHYLNAVGTKNYLLVDLGTNGELVLKYKEYIYVTSVAAGPAFEGGNIEFGTGSIPGAISGVSFDGFFTVETIDSIAPKGICGSGLISAVSCFLKNNFLDRTGLIKEDYFETGIYITEDIYITQKDIRQFQMAKSAVRAGIEILFQEAGIAYEDIEKIYLSGGFGNNIDLNGLMDTGIFPDAFAGRIETAGNTSLKGAVLWKKESRENIKEINLSNHPKFNDCYIEYMDF